MIGNLFKTIEDAAASASQINAYNAEIAYIQQEVVSAYLATHKQNQALRKDYSGFILSGVAVWLLFIMRIIWLVGEGRLFLSDGVIITLITTSTANLIACLAAIINYLFNPEKSV